MLVIIFCSVLLISCANNLNIVGPVKSYHQSTTNNTDAIDKNGFESPSYSTEVLEKWMLMQIRLMSGTFANFNGPFVRIYSYSGLSAYQAIAPSITNPSFLISFSQLNQLPDMPPVESATYYWPASLNAALAYINRAMFPFTSPANKEAMDSLENALHKTFIPESDSQTLERSIAYGKSVAQKIYAWSETDGHRLSNLPYLPPEGPGKWVPTPPSFEKASTPYWGNLRTMVSNSIENTQPVPPPAYSEDSTSSFFRMVHDVYKISQNFSEEQKKIVLFWKDINPGISAPGHWLNILRQIIQQEHGKINLDKAAFAYALTGLALNDAWISCWQTRYIYNLLRPVTYVQNVIGHKDWLPMLTTPPHPEYTSGYAAMAGAVAEALTTVFGNNYSITDHTYDYLGMTPRSFRSFTAMAKEAGDSKYLGGIHYKLSVDEGLKQGRQVTKNIVSILFKNKRTAQP